MLCHQSDCIVSKGYTYFAISFSVLVSKPLIAIDDVELELCGMTKEISGRRFQSYGQRLIIRQLLSQESERMEADLVTIYRIIHDFIDFK